MIISDDQARRVAEYLRSRFESTCAGRAPCASDELTLRVRTRIDAMPPVRQERLAQARDHMATGKLTSHEVASKMIARLLSDSLR